MKERLRNEIEEKYKWDLSVLYSSCEEWEKDFNDLKKEIPILSNYKNHLLESSKVLLEFIKKFFEIDRRLEKVYYYAHLNYDAETMNTKFQSLDGKVMNLFKDMSVATSYVEPELLKGDYSLIEKYYKEESELEEYKNFFMEIYRYKDHTLSEQEEEIISKLSKSLGVSADIYEKGVILTGGGALLTGLDELLEENLNIPVLIAESPLTCVVEGTGVLLDNIKLLEENQ